MAEGAPMMYHGNGYGAGGQVYVVGGQLERPPRQYPLEVLQIMGGVAPEASAPRRWPPRSDRHAPKAGGDSAFGYESDDSSQSSNASGSNKSGEKGESNGEGSSRSERSLSAVHTGHGARQWRARRGHRDARPPQRRIAPDRYLNSTYPFQVKFAPDDLLNGSIYDTMSQEMWDRFVKSQQTEETFRKKMNLWRYLYISIKYDSAFRMLLGLPRFCSASFMFAEAQVHGFHAIIRKKIASLLRRTWGSTNTILQTLVPRYGLYVVGSTMSGFGLDSSDMDLCLYVRPYDNLEPRAHALLHLNHILEYIKGLDPGAELIQAKVPILKFRDARNGLQVDLNCNNVVGIRNTTLLHIFSRMDWRVRPLVAVVKLWAQAHNINDARQRTLSSYSLTLMTLHYLQAGASPPLLPRGTEAGAAPPPHHHQRSANRASLAELFIGLLNYYAEFPWSRYAVSVRTGSRLPVHECRAVRAAKNDPHQWKLLCVEEPYDLTNTARSVYDPETFERIVCTFRSSAARVSAAPRLASAWPEPADPAPS